MSILKSNLNNGCSRKACSTLNKNTPEGGPGKFKSCTFDNGLRREQILLFTRFIVVLEIFVPILINKGRLLS